MINVSLSADSFCGEGDSIADAAFQHHVIWYAVQGLRCSLERRTQPAATISPAFATVTMPTSIPAGFATAVTSVTSPPPPSPGRVPPFANMAVNGSTTATLKARATADALVTSAATVWIVYLARNDWSTSIAPATSAADAQTWISAMKVAGCTRMLWCSGLCEGENWSGGNAQDANIAATNAALKAQVEGNGVGFEWVNVRAEVYTALEPILNPSSAAAGPLTILDSTGVHPVGSPGAWAIGAAILAHINVVA